MDAPAFFGYSMEREDLPLADRCVWIHGEDVIKAPDRTGFPGGKRQHFWDTDKDNWHRGLQSLIDELLKIAGKRGPIGILNF